MLYLIFVIGFLALIMSRIYETPRYKNQSFYRMLTHVDLYIEESSFTHIRKEILSHCGNTNLQHLSSSAYAYALGEYKLLYKLLYKLEPLGEGFEDDDILYHKYSYEQGTLRQNPNDHHQVVATGKVISDILISSLNSEHNGTRKIWFDSDACYRLVVGYLSGKYKASYSNKDFKRKVWAHSLSKDIASVSMASCRLGLESVNNALNNFHHFSEVGSDWKNLSAWNQALEYIRMQSVTPELKEANESLRSYSFDVKCQGS
jgi:hypothetical protein